MYQLFEQARLGPLTLRNRTVRSATNEHLSTREGQLTPAWKQVQTCLAEHETGLVITGHMTVDRRYRADIGQPVMDGETDLTLLREAAEEIHGFGGSIAVQLSHSGLKADVSTNGRPPKGPGDFTVEELDELTERFTEAALLCRSAGADGVQIHLAHGYLLSSFLNPALNTRTDGYGGSLENRFRLPDRIIRSVRAACGPDFALLVKVDCDASGDLSGTLKRIQAAGADGAEISGLSFNARAGEKEPFFLREAAAAQGSVTMPLILVGGIFSRQAAQEVLDAGIPFVSFCRALICEPDFVEGMKNGTREVSSCLACNGCYRVYRTRHVRCVQHRVPVPHLAELYGAK